MGGKGSVDDDNDEDNEQDDLDHHHDHDQDRRGGTDYYDDYDHDHVLTTVMLWHRPSGHL